MIDTTVGAPISGMLIRNYFESLVNAFFKILPIRESGETTLPIYIRSLQTELIGCKEFICELNNNACFLTLLSILQYLYDHPECPVQDVKREIFRAIGICNKLKIKYEKAVR